MDSRRKYPGLGHSKHAPIRKYHRTTHAILYEKSIQEIAPGTLMQV